MKNDCAQKAPKKHVRFSTLFVNTGTAIAGAGAKRRFLYWKQRARPNTKTQAQWNLKKQGFPEQNLSKKNALLFYQKINFISSIKILL